MLIQHRLIGNKGLFFVGKEGAILAELAYNISPAGRMVIEHTEVSDALRGRNVGYELVHRAVEYARTHGILIVPFCPFARSVFRKQPAFADVLAQP